MRKLPKRDGHVIAPNGTVEPDLLRNNTMIRQERKYELIYTSLGGGVEPGKNDDITPISGKGIRGQLRFWWRATRGGQFNGSLKDLKKCEAEIWGAASTENANSISHVEIEVCDVLRVGTQEKPYKAKGKVNNGWEDLAYAAFPFQDNPQEVCKYKFTLKVSYPESIKRNDGGIMHLKKEIDAALWAWSAFGGVGARTRRGFGILNSGTLPPKVNKIEMRMKDDLNHYVEQEKWPESVPHLTRDLSFVIVSKKEHNNRVPFASVNEVWEHLIKGLKDFRQARSGRIGRSKWPEPEQIRRITGQRSHPADPILLSVEKFPRAVFGLPIIFHFKGGNEKPPYSLNLEPVITTLKGNKDSNDEFYERLASPLILRPLSCGINQAVGLAVLPRGSTHSTRRSCADGGRDS